MGIELKRVSCCAIGRQILTFSAFDGLTSTLSQVPLTQLIEKLNPFKMFDQKICANLEEQVFFKVAVSSPGLTPCGHSS